MTTKSRIEYEKRKMAILAIQRGETPKTVARFFKVTRRTIYAWLAAYRSEGWHALKPRKKTGRKPTLDAEKMQWLYETITLGDPRQLQFDFALWSLRVIRAALYKKYGLSLSKSSLCRLMKQLGITPQRPIYRAYKQDAFHVARWKRTQYPRLRRMAQKHGWQLFFIDESAFRSDAHRGTSWAKKGETPVVKEHRGRHGMNFISAVNPLGKLWFDAYEGRMDSERFIEFLKKMLGDIEGKIWGIADRATFHTSQKTRAFLKEHKARIRLAHLPRYAPELNPDEQVWNHAKTELGKRIIGTKEEMKKAGIEILKRLEKKVARIRSFFKLPNTRYALA